MKTVTASLAASLVLAGAAAAQEPTPTPAQRVIRPADSALTCVQIADEAAQLSQAMGGDPDDGALSSLTDVAKAGAATFIPGAGLLIAGADALTAGDRQRRIAEALAQQNRWFYLNGLHAGRGCMDDPAPAAAPAAPASGQASPPRSTTPTPPSTTPPAAPESPQRPQ